MKKKFLKLGIFLLMLSVIVLPGSSPLHATTWTVNTTSDDFNNPAEGSLRYAVNNAVSGDVISFDLTYPATINLDVYYLNIDSGMTIQGPGADKLTIAGGGTYWVFYIATSDTLEISGITITGGGGASHGGGISCISSNPKIKDCNIIGNTAIYGGGGIYFQNSSPTVTGCTFKDNVADNNYGQESSGGAIESNNSYITVINCTFIGNRAMKGGAIYDNGYNEIINCTFTGNTAFDHYPYTGIGGAIFIAHPGVSTFSNCILWGNSPKEVLNNSMGSSLFEYCVVQNANFLSPIISSNIITADPVLGTLADNGGPTWTCALGEGSSAIDTGKTLESVTTDQRGVPRPQGYGYDIGAYEDDSGPVVEYYVISADWSAGGSVSPSVAYAVSGDCEDKEFTLLPDSGYEIGEVLVDEVPESYDEATNTYTFYNIDQDHQLYVSFSATISDDDDDKDKDKDKDDKDKDKDDKDKDKDDKDKDDLTLGSSGTGPDGTDPGGESGGCNTGNVLPSMLLLIAPLLILAKKK